MAQPGNQPPPHPGQGKQRYRGDYGTHPGWQLATGGVVDADALRSWIQDMAAWAQDVRDDLLRMEGAVGFAAGDPGDPPPPPM